MITEAHQDLLDSLATLGPSTLAELLEHTGRVRNTTRKHLQQLRWRRLVEKEQRNCWVITLQGREALEGTRRAA